MQVKKEVVRDKLLIAGEKIFMEEGFEKASLRKIVKDAGTTIGNFYNYFPNKEALFITLVEEDFIKFSYFIEHHEDNDEAPDTMPDMNDLAMLSERLTEFIGSLVPIFTPRFLLLVDKSKGTKFEGFRQSIIDFFEAHYLDHVRRLGKEDKDPYSEVLSTMFVDGLINLIRTYMYDENLGKYIARHFMFFTIGTMGMLTNDLT